MSSPFGKAVVIANTRAGKGAVELTELARAIESTGIDFEVRPTEHAGHATEIATAALDEGCRYLVAVGGDGTIHEVVNGMMDERGPRHPDAVLGILPAGSGSDFIRTFGLPSALEDAVKHLAGDSLFTIDAARLTYRQGAGEATRYFINIAEAGFGGECVRRAARLPRRLGRVRYLLAFWVTLAKYRYGHGRVLLDERVFEGRVTNLVVANAQFFGGGMRVAPKAHPSDGHFDVLIQRGTKRDYVAAITKVFKGDHIPSPAIKEYRAAKVVTDFSPDLQVEADGEVLGFTPATFEIVPEAVRLKI